MRHFLFLVWFIAGTLLAQARAGFQTPVDAAVMANAGADTLVYKNQTRPDSVFLNGFGSTPGQTYRWEWISGPAQPQVQTPDAITSWVTGLVPGFHQFRLTVNEIVSDTVTAYVRDWQQKGIYPCRAGYDTISKSGGLKIVLEPTHKGTFIKSDGTTGTWNQWNFITDVRGYVQSTKKLTLSGGDTLLLEGADSTVWVELGGFGGDQGCPVYVMPRTKPVRIRGVNAFFRIATRDSNVVQHVVVDGTTLRSAGYPYGFLFDNAGLGYAGNGAFTAGWVANFTIKGLHSNKTNAFKIKQDPTVRPYSRYDKWIQRNISITDNWIDSSSVEGLYIGSSASDGGQTAYGWPIRMEHVSITNNLITNCKWDGIQLANAKSGNEIKHNLVYKVGTANQASQRAGILFGGNTTGVVDSNLVVNSKGDGIQVFGYGPVQVFQNIIDSIYGGSGDQDGMYHSFISFDSEPNNIPLSIFNSGNLIGRVERNMIRVANNNNLMLPGRTNSNTYIHATATDPNALVITNVNGDVLENNAIVKAFPYTLHSLGILNGQAGFSITQGDTTQRFVTVKTAVEWLFNRLKSVSADNVPPVVKAGLDTTIILPLDSVQLQGNATDAAGGSIVQYQWTNVSGSTTVRMETPAAAQTIVRNLTEGTYMFELAALDNGGLTGKDTIQVTVLPLPNIAPKAFAGADTIINLPATSLTLKGTGADTDGTITGVRWTKISGPSATIQNATALQTTVSGLQAGTYNFELQVTDNRNATAADTVRVLVNAPPSANAGTDQTLTLPTNTTTLSGTTTDADGTIATSIWQKISGPTQGSITSPNATATTITALVAGTYVFRFTATDNQGAQASDEVSVTVTSAPVVTTKNINVNIYGGSNAYSNSAWNNWSLKTRSVGSTTSSKFKYADGTTSAVTATLSASSAISDNGSSYGSGMAPAPVLRYTSYYTSTRTLTLKGLSPSKKYSVELYASRNTSGSSTILTINGVSQTIATYNNFTSKAVFTNLTPTSSGQIVITLAKSGSFNCLNGFSITEAATTTNLKTITVLKKVAEENTTAQTGLTVFPNPAQNTVALRLQTTLEGTAHVTIVASSGQVVRRAFLINMAQQRTLSFSISDLAAGIYLIQVQLGKERWSQPFVKQ